MPEEEDARTVAFGRELGRRGDAEGLDDGPEAGKRMPRDVEAEHLLFEGEALVRVPLRHHLGRLSAGDRGRRGQAVEPGPELAAKIDALLGPAALVVEHAGRA